MRNSCVSFVKSSVLLKKRIPLLASSPSSTSYIVVARNREDLTSPSLMDTVYLFLSRKDLLHCWSLATSFYKGMRQEVK